MTAAPLPLRVTLQPSLRAPRAARQLLSTWLVNAGCGEEHRADALVIVSELVTNAVVHAGTALTIVALSDLDTGHVDRMVRLEVHDGERNDPVPRPPGDRVGGRGLGIVAGLALRWGWDHTTEGKSVWAEIVC